MNIGFLGAGSLARSLGALAARCGHDVRFGVRQLRADGFVVSAQEAAAFGDIFILASPYSALAEALPPLRRALAGKIVVDATNPVGPDWAPLPLDPRQSAAEGVAQDLPGCRLVKAFNTIFADSMRWEDLNENGRRISTFIAADDVRAAYAVAGFAEGLGFDPLVAGPLAHARYLEAMAHLNIALMAQKTVNTRAALHVDRGGD